MAFLKMMVPITKAKKCGVIFPSEFERIYSRESVWVLPTFSMTDYTSRKDPRPKIQ